MLHVPSVVGVRLALMWTLQSQFAGYVVARARELPELELVPRADGRSPMLELLEGRAEYGIVSPAHLLAAGADAREVALVALFMSRSPIRMAGLRERVGDSLVPRHGLRVGIWRGEDVELRAMLRLAGIDLADVEFVPVADEARALLEGEVDYVQSTTYNELPAIVAAAGRRDRVVAHDPARWKVDVAKDGVAVRREVLEADPLGVAHFVRGAICGWRRVLEDPAAAVAELCRAVPNLDPETQGAQLERLVALFDPAHELGQPRMSDIERARHSARVAGDPCADSPLWIDPGPWERGCLTA
jgi:ABC-type nitrate/sulfonate/bicarbonate transport system substrate-binding protein